MWSGGTDDRRPFPLSALRRGGQGVRPLGGPLRISLVIAAALALAACSRPTGPIAVGLAGPFSQPRGASMLRAAQLAVNQINAKRGIRGRKLELRIVDDSGNEDAAVRAAEELYADPAVVAVVGDFSSGTSLPAGPVYGGGAAPAGKIFPPPSRPPPPGGRAQLVPLWPP